MTDTEKIVNKTKEYVLNLYSEGYSNYRTMVNGLKDGVDLFVGRKDGIDTIKEEIMAKCLYEFDKKTKVFDNIGHIKMIDTIKSNFIKFVTELDINQLTEFSPIPFERRLEERESLRLEAALKLNFDFGTWKDENYYWEPLCETESKTERIYFEDSIFKKNDLKKIAQIIISLSGDRVFLLTEEKLNYEVESLSFNIDWLESAYTNLDTNWLIYISHEGTVTFAGESIVKFIEEELREILDYKNPWD